MNRILLRSILGCVCLSALQSCGRQSNGSVWRAEEVRGADSEAVRYTIYRGSVLRRIQVAEKADQYAIFGQDCVLWRTGESARAACGDHAPAKIVADRWTETAVPATLSVSECGLSWDERSSSLDRTQEGEVRHWVIPMDSIAAVARAQPPLDGARVLGRPWPLRSVEIR
jgi:hypothetical protein